MSTEQGLPDWWPTLSTDIIEAYLALSSTSDSDDLLDNFESKKPSFFALAEPLVQKFNIPDLTQNDSYFIGQDLGRLPITGDIPQQYSARLIWASAVAIQRKLSPHLLAVAKDKSYQPGEETRSIRLAFSVLTPDSFSFVHMS
ncbi:hypothetical protein BDP27DRAFT_1434244 [Rhodocollybia butyracea]|uniref:Uncharacterized protein n=1 Tax=Rhodocollybia butyracea TaxID=206335 RepID=A0A9P5P2U1_9AGAR|nr:hypothetical protein BDP27DRAFT_1434244 [Rhodocollybia butyracea]